MCTWEAYTRAWDQIDSTACRALALHAASLSSILSISSAPQTPPGVIPEYKSGNNPWASLGVALKQNNKAIHFGELPTHHPSHCQVSLSPEDLQALGNAISVVAQHGSTTLTIPSHEDGLAAAGTHTVTMVSADGTQTQPV